MFSAGLFACILRKTVKLAVKINLAAATRFDDEKTECINCSNQPLHYRGSSS